MSSDQRTSAVESERLRRMALVWSEDRASDRECATARRACARRSRARSSAAGRPVLAMAALMLVMIGGVVAWASQPGMRNWLLNTAEPEPARPAASLQPPHRVPIGQAASAAPPESPALSAESLPLLPPEEPSSRSSTALPASSSPAPVPSSSSSATAALEQDPKSTAWERAAESMRNSDPESADTALAEIARGSDAEAADAAWLARAQIWISQGREKEAAPVLDRLAANGATPLIRRRAVELRRSLQR